MIRNLISLTLFIGSAKASVIPKENPTICVALHCFMETGACWADSECYAILDCLQGCPETSNEAQCSLACIMTAPPNDKFDAVMECMAENDCIAQYPQDGQCLASDDEALQSITDIAQLQGDWWVVKGLNCGQSEEWYGGQDWLPCQHGRFEQLDDGQWINNTTFCNGIDNVCTSDLIITIPELVLIGPGVVRHNYPKGEAPLIPQIEDWKFVSVPDPDWAFVLWCGSNPVVDYNGGYVISRHRNLDPITPEIEAEFRKVTERFGVNYDELCVSDNNHCIE
jgi:hypothetical protein